jgi:hypothetical protein
MVRFTRKGLKTSGALKRGLNGTYVAVEPFHLFRYVDEQVFIRFNNRLDLTTAKMEQGRNWEIRKDLNWLYRRSRESG